MVFSFTGLPRDGASGIGAPRPPPLGDRGADAEPVECVTDTEIGVEEHVGIAEASHDGVAGGPLTDAGKRHEALHELLPIGAGVERDRTVGDGRREPGDRATARPRHRQRAGIERGESIGRREHVGEPVVGDGQQVTGCLDDAGGDGAGAGDRHLLADHAAHRDLERVDGARGASPWRLGDERLEDRIVTENGIDGDRVGVEVEEPAETLDGRGQIAPVGE